MLFDINCLKFCINSQKKNDINYTVRAHISLFHSARSIYYKFVYFYVCMIILKLIRHTCVAELTMRHLQTLRYVGNTLPLDPKKKKRTCESCVLGKKYKRANYYVMWDTFE